MRYALATVLLLGACATQTEPHTLAIATQVVVVQGDSQLGTVHQALGQPIGVRVLDDKNQPLAGQPVVWHVVKGGGSVFAGFGVTDTLGMAHEQWTLGDTAGAQEVEARAVDDKGQPIVYARITATAKPGPIASAGFTVHQLRLLGDSVVMLPVHATDSYGNLVTAPVLNLDSTATGTAAAGGRWAVKGIGLARFTVSAPSSETLTVFVSPPLGTFRAQYHAADTTVIETGTIASAAIDTLGGPGLATACYSYAGTPARGRTIYTLQNVRSIRIIGAGVPDTVQLASLIGGLAHVADDSTRIWYASAHDVAMARSVCRSAAMASAAPKSWQFSAAAGIDSLAITP